MGEVMTLGFPARWPGRRVVSRAELCCLWSPDPMPQWGVDVIQSAGQRNNPEVCRHCGAAIVPDDVLTGQFRHVDRQGGDAGWMCRPPHMTLAQPVRRPEIHGSWQAGSPQVAPIPRRKPTPIPPLRARDDAPQEWPPAEGPAVWWENP